MVDGENFPSARHGRISNLNTILDVKLKSFWRGIKKNLRIFELTVALVSV